MAVLAVALGVRCAYVLSTRGYRPVFDGGDYVRIAVSLAHGHGWAGSVFTPGASAFRPPLYPLFLATVFAATGDSITAARLAQSVVGTAGVALIGLVAWQLAGRRAALAAAGIAAVLPALVVLDGALMSETLFLPLMTASVAAALRARRSPRRLAWAGATGGIAALAVLSRPNGLLLVVGLALLVPAGLRHRARSALVEGACVLAAALVVVTPWTIRNAVTFHALVPITDSAGFDLAGIYNPVQQHAAQPYTGGWAYPPTLREFRPLFSDRRQNEYQLTSRLQTAAVRYAEHHPAYVVEVAGLNTWRILGGQPSHWVDVSRRAVGVGGPSGAAWYAGWLVLVGLGLAATALGAWRRIPAVLWVTPVLLLLSASQADGEARYRAPVEVFVVLLAGVGLATAWDRLRGPAAPRPPQEEEGTLDQQVAGAGNGHAHRHGDR